jgi:hypothetical protein
MSGLMSAELQAHRQIVRDLGGVYEDDEVAVPVEDVAAMLSKMNRGQRRALLSQMRREAKRARRA